MSERIDLGNDHVMHYFGWSPDRELNPQYEGIADIERGGVIIDHPHHVTGEPCSGAVTFETMRNVYARGSQYEREAPMWHVVSWEPLTIEPSILCACGDHGYITDGRWVPA